jgi:hypothetical protein
VRLWFAMAVCRPLREVRALLRCRRLLDPGSKNYSVHSAVLLIAYCCRFTLFQEASQNHRTLSFAGYKLKA